MKYIKKYEHPDHFLSPKKDILFLSSDKGTFSFVNYGKDNKLFISKEREPHEDSFMYHQERNGEKINLYNYSNELKLGVNIWQGINGRIWVYKKAISFWDFDSKLYDFSQFLKDIKEQLKLQEDIDVEFDDEWIVERKNGIEWEIIKLSEFDGETGNTKEEWIDHRKHGKEKADALKRAGYKPKIPSKWKKWMKPFESFNY